MAKKKGKLSGEWGSRVLSALDVIDKASQKQQYDATHTSDGMELKVGLQVFVLDDPKILWTISEIDEKTYRRRVLLEAKGQVPIKRHTIKLFVNQKKAVDACIKDIKQAEKIALRDMRESLKRLNAYARIKELKKLKKIL
jgi:hypothetical protein